MDILVKKLFEDLIFYWFIIFLTGVVLIALFLGRKKVCAFLKFIWTKLWARIILKIILVLLIIAGSAWGFYNMRDKIITDYHTDPDFCLFTTDCVLDKTDCSFTAKVVPLNIFNRIYLNCPSKIHTFDTDIHHPSVKCQDNKCIKYFSRFLDF